MHLLAILLHGLMALFGSHSDSVAANINVFWNGRELIVSRTRAQAGVLSVRCLLSSSGYCHYRLHRPIYAGTLADGGRQVAAQHLTLHSGQVRELQCSAGTVSPCVSAIASAVAITPRSPALPEKGARR